MQRERQEEHEGAEGGVSLEVHVDVVAAALRLGTSSVSMRVVPDLWYEGLPLHRRPPQFPAVEDNPLHDEDGEEARRHDELGQRETGLRDSNTDALTLARDESEHLLLRSSRSRSDKDTQFAHFTKNLPRTPGRH